MNSIKFKSDIDYIDQHWKQLNNIIHSIKTELPVLDKTIQSKPISKFLHTIQYKDLTNWDVKTQIGVKKSKTLIVLADKISHMIYKGDSVNVLPMLKRIVYKGIKKQTIPTIQDNPAEFLGHGHFRWNNSCISLDETEVKRIKEYFDI